MTETRTRLHQIGQQAAWWLQFPVPRDGSGLRAALRVSMHYLLILKGRAVGLKHLSSVAWKGCWVLIALFEFSPAPCTHWFCLGNREQLELESVFMLQLWLSWEGLPLWAHMWLKCEFKKLLRKYAVWYWRPLREWGKWQMLVSGLWVAITTHSRCIQSSPWQPPKVFLPLWQRQ